MNVLPDRSWCKYFGFALNLVRDDESNCSDSRGIPPAQPTLKTFPHQAASDGNVLQKDCFVACCTTPFEVQKSTSEERAGMLLTSSITKFEDGWREEDVSGFDREMAAIKDHHISRRAFWMPYGPDPINSRQYGEVFLLIRRDRRTRLWWSRDQMTALSP